MTLLLLLLLTNDSFASNNFNESYQLLQGKWNAPFQDSEMDVIMDISSKGAFTLSVKPAFEYTNLSVQDQEKTIEAVITSTGHLKFLNTVSNIQISDKELVNTEILLNNEFSTNLLEILSNQVFIFESETQLRSLFLQR